MPMKRNPLLLSLIPLCLAAGIGLSLWGKSRPVAPAERPTEGRELEVEADGPDEALKWRRKTWVDENGRIPEDALVKASAQRVALLRPSPRLPGDQWVQRGPDNVPGRCRVLVIHPTKTNILWMATAGGGVWKSLDSGKNWSPKSDRLASIAVSALVLDPKNPDILYAGTGEGFYNIDAIQGAGIYKSIDGGETWNLLPSTKGFEHVNRITIHPTDSKIMIAAVAPGGFFRTIDGGSTWTRTFSTEIPSCAYFVPYKPASVVGAHFDGSKMAAVYSTDGGVTWKTSTGGLASMPGFGRIEVMPAPKGDGIVYAQADDGFIYKSTDFGASYVKVSASGTETGQLWYDNGLWIDPTNANVVVALSISPWRSTDGGVNITRIGNWLGDANQPHADAHGFFSDPGYNGTTNKIGYICTDGGVYRTDDILTASTTAGWTPLGQTARTTQYYGVAAHGPTGLIVGGTQDNGTLSLKPGSDTAFKTFGGDGGYCAIDSLDPKYVYGEYVFLNIFRDTSGGDGVNDFITSGLTDANSRANFIAPFILDPNRPQVMLAGGASLWRCPDAKAASYKWTAIKSALGGGNYISAIAVAPGNSDIIYVANNGGQLFKTTNGKADSPTWTTIDDNSAANPLPNRYITRILVDPSDNNKVYVSLGGFSEKNLWMTTNGGTSWVARTGTGANILPQAPIRAIARHPDNANTLYVGTEVGIFSSADGGLTWTTTNDAPANVSVEELVFASGSTSLVAATHGRGIWVLSKPSPLKTLEIAPTSVAGGNTATATVTLSNAAPLGGQVCTLKSSSTLATVPATLTIPGGATKASFTVNTSGVARNTDVTISATNGTTLNAKLTITPPALNTVAINPVRVNGGSASVGTVTLSGNAPTGGLAVTLSSNNANATVPASVTIPAGAASATFSIGTKIVATNTTATITATSNGVSKTATLQVDNVTLNTLALSPTTVAGGAPTTLTATLAVAPIADVTLKLTTNNAAVVTTPASLVIPAGKTQGSVTLTPSAVTAVTYVSFTTSYQGQWKSATLTVRPSELSAIKVDPASVVGGSGTTVTGTVSLTGSAPTGGTVVSLKSSLASVTVPASVTVAAGATSATFAVKHSVVAANSTATLTANVGTLARTATLTVTPIGIKGLTLNPTSVAGGETSKATVEISGPAPTGGATVTIAVTGTVATAPKTVVIAAGQTKADFNITTTKVAADTTVKVTTTYNSTSASADLKVLNFSLGIDSFTISPNRVGGFGRIVVGTVTLNGTAPAEGVTITITSSDPAVATSQATLVIKNAKSATFPIQSFVTDDSTVVTFTVKLGTSTKTAALFVN